MDFLFAIWILFQVAVGYNLVFPAILYIFWRLFGKGQAASKYPEEADYGIIVTAYQYTDSLPIVVDSLLKLNYSNYLIYVVADNCEADNLHFMDPRVVLLVPETVLASNTNSHAHAVNNFRRKHDYITIIDSDNLTDREYLNELNVLFAVGYEAVQGLRAAKNLDGTIACLDAARDIYYHFYDGKLLFESGSSATLSGSGMAFSSDLYSEFLYTHQIKGAGFDKVLQAWILNTGKRIAFAGKAVVYDEKTSRPDQLVSQRSRWINTWFKYFSYGFKILMKGILRFNRNQFFFGLVLLRPPLFIFLILSVFCFLINLFLGYFMFSAIWMVSLLTFVLFFLVSLWSSTTDQRIFKSLKNIPQFIFYQILSLMNVTRANKISVSTKHYHKEGEVR
jgi:cellulose synthase/poly-beta-1,6-N-acetylglucosamine synthase-like glycosyltransferase